MASLPPVTAARIAALSAPSLNNYGPSNPLYIGHRSCGLLFPEESLESYRLGFNRGLNIFEGDAWLLTDNALGMMHDSTVDRTTTSTGNIQSLDSAGYLALAIDGNSWHGSNYGNALHTVLFPDLLKEFKGRAIFFIEAKSAGNTGLKICDALTNAGILKTQALVNSFTLSQLSPAQAAGYPVSFNATTGDSTEIASAVAAGVKNVGLNAQNHSDTVVSAWIAAGFTVIMAGANRRQLRNKYAAMGVWMFYMDDPDYAATDKPFSTTDSFVAQTWQNGIISGGSPEGYALTANSRGLFSLPKYWGFADQGIMGVLQGWACPIKGDPAANNFTITFNFIFDSVSASDRWGSVMIADVSMLDHEFDANGANNQYGYHCLFRQNGTIQIYKYVNGTPTLIVQQTAGAARTLGTSYKYKIIVTPTNVQLLMYAADGTTLDQNITAFDTSYRGGYFHFCHSGAACRFSDVSIT